MMEDWWSREGVWKRMQYQFVDETSVVRVGITVCIGILSQFVGTVEIIQLVVTICQYHRSSLVIARAESRNANQNIWREIITSADESSDVPGSGVVVGGWLSMLICRLRKRKIWQRRSIIARSMGQKYVALVLCFSVGTTGVVRRRSAWSSSLAVVSSLSTTSSASLSASASFVLALSVVVILCCMVGMVVQRP